MSTKSTAFPSNVNQEEQTIIYEYHDSKSFCSNLAKKARSVLQHPCRFQKNLYPNNKQSHSDMFDQNDFSPVVSNITKHHFAQMQSYL